MADRKGGRARTGGLLWKSGQWYGRWSAEVDGETIRVVRALGTTSKPVAKRKLGRLMNEGAPSPEEVERPDTFTEAATRVLEGQEAQGLATIGDRRSRLTRYALPVLGSMPVTDVRAQDVREVLTAARDAGRARQTILNFLHDVSSVLGELWRADELAENVAKRVRIKDILPHSEQRPERAVLTDVELVRYLGRQHPEKRFRMPVLERQTMACVARMLGGQRTSDLHAARWEDFELPEFTEARVRSKKTGKVRRLAVPAMLRPILEDWWTRRKEPTEGPVFPVRRGKRAGEHRTKKSSHAKALRRDLRRAFGIEVWDGEDWKDQRDLTPAKRSFWTATPRPSRSTFTHGGGPTRRPWPRPGSTNSRPWL